MKKIIIGEKYGRLTVIKELERGKHKERRVLASCSCDGNIKEYDFNSLSRGLSKSCGCLRSQVAKEKATTHKSSGSKLYMVYHGMKQRCSNENHISYPWYGEQGVKICSEWLRDFEIFKNWAENNGYKEGLEIDRINSSGNYEPSNCRFVTRQINNINQGNRKDNKTGYRGVYKIKDKDKYRSELFYNKEKVFFKTWLGSPEEAALARDIFIIKNNLPHPLSFPELKYWGVI